MADPQSESTSGSTVSGGSSNVKRYLLIGAPIVLAVIVMMIVFWPRIELGFKINALNTDSVDTHRRMRQELIQAPREAWVDDTLREAMEDASRSFEVRHMLAGVLAERNRLGSHIEPAYLEGDVGTRRVILAYLDSQPYFEKTYVADPRFAVRETTLAWLANADDYSRLHAVQIARTLEMREALDGIRQLLEIPPEAYVPLMKRRRALLEVAMSAIDQFKDCASLARIFEMAQEANEDPVVRWRAAQVTDRMVTGEKASCPGAVSEEAIAAVMVDFLDHADNTPRIGALTNFERHPERARGSVDRLLDILDNGAMGDGPERRHALHVLLQLGDPAFMDRLPAYFFDPNMNVRSSLALRAADIDTPRLDSGLIGLVADETESLIVFRHALESLRQRAKTWHGLTKKLRRRMSDDRGNFQADIETMYKGGEIDGVTRASMADAWFVWLAGDLGLAEPDIGRAVAARKAFWAAAGRGDRAEAQKSLDQFGVRSPGLFTYEEAWLDRESR